MPTLANLTIEIDFESGNKAAISFPLAALLRPGINGDSGCDLFVVRNYAEDDAYIMIGDLVLQNFNTIYDF